MSNSITRDLVEAVKDYLLTKTFSSPVQFSRENLPVVEIEGFAESFIASVYPGARTAIKYTRSAYLRRFLVNVGAYTIGAAGSDREDELITLGEEIEFCLLGTRFVGIGPDANEFDRADEGDITIAPFIPTELESQGVVMVVVPVTYTNLTEQPVQGKTVIRQYVRDEEENYHRDTDINYVAGS